MRFVLFGLTLVATVTLVACGATPRVDRTAALGPSGSRVSVRHLVLTDSSRARSISVTLYEPPATHPCARARTCGVVFLSPGFGLPHTAYAFLAEPLAEVGYVVAAIQHDLPTDPPLATTGTLVEIRTPLWTRGVANLRFVRAALATREPALDWAHLVLIGHSNGGDLSALALAEAPALATTLVTLDHRRVALPRTAALRVLSLRGSDFAPDPGVLPDPPEAAALGYCITSVAGARHDDMQDEGPAWLKAELTRRVVEFLHERRCAEN